MRIRKLKSFVASGLTVAMLAMGSLTSFAATGWIVNSDNTWSYIENDEKVTDSWEKSGEGYFYLDENGIMVTNKVVENADGTLSFANSEGARVTNQWVFAPVPTHDGETHWIYVQSNGKSEMNGWETINGKRYHFTDNVMDYGYLDADGNMINTDEADPWLSATYYMGDESNGARYTGWQFVDAMDIDEYDNMDEIWIYFGSDGKKYVDKIATINGVKYKFDENGVMVQEWAIASSSTASSSNAQYYNSDGSMIKNNWVYTTAMNDEDGDEYWFYFDSKGNMVMDEVKKINGKYYAFDSEGRMLTGFVSTEDLTVIGSDEDLNIEDVMEIEGDYYYFADSDDGATEGAAMTGKTVMELDGDKVTIMFDKKGVVDKDLKQSGYLYVNGVLQKADSEGDYNYQAIEVDGAYFLVNKSGKIITKNVTDRESTKWVFDKEAGTVTHFEKDEDTKKYEIVLNTYNLHD